VDSLDFCPKKGGTTERDAEATGQEDAEPVSEKRAAFSEVDPFLPSLVKLSVGPFLSPDNCFRVRMVQSEIRCL